MLEPSFGPILSNRDCLFSTFFQIRTYFVLSALDPREGTGQVPEKLKDCLDFLTPRWLNWEVLKKIK